MIHFTMYLLVVTISLGGVLLNIFSLPGNWVMMLAAALLSWGTGWSRPSLSALGVMVVILLMGETVDLLGSVVGARKFGASKGATWAALAGAIAGALIGTPVPVVGNILGAILGAFIAAWVVELVKKKPMKSATWAAVGAALGKTMGITVKLGCGFIVWLGVIWFAWPW
jgi:uncharacterized protein YqgC (DUF456 family)